MDPSNLDKMSEKEVPRYLNFKHAPEGATHANGKQMLNRFSTILTREHDFPGAQVRFSC
jgi:dihydroxy-acid dehydratase